MDIITRVTNKIDQYGTGIEWGTEQDVGVNLWNDLDNILNHSNKNNIISNWKYKNEFECAENWHMNGKQLFKLMSWENSFALAILFTVYH
jgi:hypothetical protein